MLKRLMAVAVLSSAVMLSSCNEIETVELNQRMIIEAVGIDFSDGEYLVTIEGLDSLTVGNESSSVSGESLTRCYTFTGVTIGTAMNQISAKTGQIPLFSQARVLIIGKSTAEARLHEVLDFFRREYTTRTDVLIAVSEGAARDVLSENFGKNISAGKIIETALDSWKYSSRVLYVPLYKFLNQLTNETDCAVCPFIGTEKNEFSELSEVSLLGTAVFPKDEGFTVLSPEKTLALSVFLNRTENGDLTVTTDKGICTIEIIDCSTKIKTRHEDGKIIFSVSSILRCDIPEFLTSDFASLTEADTEEIAYLTAEKLSGLMHEIINEYYYEQNYDIFRIGRRINLTDHGEYEDYIGSTDDRYNKIAFHIKTDVSIRRIGKVLLKSENANNSR